MDVPASRRREEFKKSVKDPDRYNGQREMKEMDNC